MATTRLIITIDGPTASGKSLAARTIAHTLGIYYLNSGILYRALAYLLLSQKQYTIEQLAEPHVQDVGEYLDPHVLVYTYTQEQERVFFKNQDITPFLKGSIEIDQGASIVSTDQYARNMITTLLRTIGSNNSLCTDGRDMGSVVFPYATYKFFLTARLEVRAQRWQNELQKRGILVSAQQAQEQLILRDKRDMERKIAPLIVPHSSIVIDNSDLNPYQTVSAMLKHIQKIT